MTGRRSRLLSTPRTILGLANLYAASRLLGLAREMGIAFFFGTAAAADRLSAAFVVASLVSIVGGEAVYGGSVRWLGRVSREGSAAVDEPRYTDLVAVGRRAALSATAAFALLGPVATLLILGRLEHAGETIALSVALAPSVGASLLAACVNARLTLERRFALLNGVQILYSAGALAGLTIIAAVGSEVGPLLIAVGWSAGVVAASLVLYARARPEPTGGRSSTSAWEVLRIGLPLAIAYSLVASQGLTDRTIAARLGEGNVAALSYADRLFLLPIGFVIAAIGPMVLGTLVTGRHREQVKTVALEQMRTLVAFVIPLSLVFVGVAPGLVSLIFESGEFDANSRELTVAALDGFSIGIAAVAVSLVLFRIMQAVTDLREIVIVAVVAVILNAVTSIAGAAWAGLYGVTLSTSLVGLAVVQLQTVRLSDKLGKRWAAEMFRRTILPVAGCCGLSIIVVTAHHRQVLGEGGRAAILVGAAAVAAVTFAARRERVR